MSSSWRQKRVKEENRQKILGIIESKRPTFKELSEDAGLSDPTLSEHLKELQKAGYVRRQAEGKRIFYELTDAGRGRERLRRESISQAMKLIGQLASDNSLAKTLKELSEFARDEPEFFDWFLRWWSDYMTLVLSEETLRWMQEHGDTSGKLLQAEAMKRLKANVKSGEFSGLQGVRLAYQDLLDAVQEVVTEGRRIR